MAVVVNQLVDCYKRKKLKCTKKQGGRQRKSVVLTSLLRSIIIFNDVFFRFCPPFVSSPVSNVTSIGNMVAN